MKRVFQIILALAAVGFFVWTISDLGLARVWQSIARIGGWAPLVLAPYFVVYVVDCIAWAQTLPPRKISFPRLFAIRWAGESVNNVLPSAYVGGEAAKIYLLRRSGVSGSDGAVAAVVSKTVQTVTQLLFIMLAAVCALMAVPNQPGRIAAIVLVLLAGLAGIGALRMVLRAGVFRLAMSCIRWAPRRVANWLRSKEPKLLELDQTIRQFRRQHPRRFYTAGLWYFSGWLLDTVEIVVVARLLNVPITWDQAIVVEAFTGIAKVAGTWIPGSLGVQESGIVLMSRVTGLPDAFGAAYAVIRRARELTFALAGVVLFYSFGARLRSASSRLAASEPMT